MATYWEKLKDRRWQQKRLYILQMHNWKCQWCKSENNSEQLHVHHGYYEKNFDPWDYPDDCYYSLCEDCHDKATDLQRRLRRAVGTIPPWQHEQLLNQISPMNATTDSEFVQSGPLTALWKKFFREEQPQWLLEHCRNSWTDKKERYGIDDDTREIYEKLRPVVWDESKSIVNYWIQYGHKWHTCEDEGIDDPDDVPPLAVNESEILPLIEIFAGMTLGRVRLFFYTPFEQAELRLRAFMRIASASEMDLSMEQYRDRWSMLEILLTGFDGPYGASFEDRITFAMAMYERVEQEREWRETPDTGVNSTDSEPSQ